MHSSLFGLWDTQRYLAKHFRYRYICAHLKKKKIWINGVGWNGYVELVKGQKALPQQEWCDIWKLDVVVIINKEIASQKFFLKWKAGWSILILQMIDWKESLMYQNKC